MTPCAFHGRLATSFLIGGFVAIVLTTGCGQKPELAESSHPSERDSHDLAVPETAEADFEELPAAEPPLHDESSFSEAPSTLAEPAEGRTVEPAKRVSRGPASFARRPRAMAPAATAMAPASRTTASASDTPPRAPASLPESISAADVSGDLPAAATRGDGDAFVTIPVFYATDRLRSAVPLSAYQISGQKKTFFSVVAFFGIALAVSIRQLLRRRPRTASLAMILTGMSGCIAGLIVMSGGANIEKHGVTYGGDRGSLQRGVCEVTVPDSHQRGQVERPSLLRLEFHEHQDKHIVLTSAVELTKEDFQRRLASSVDQTDARDMLVFVHGYNVDFQSAVQRTAQIAVDLPFEGVPVCYSWPSQATLLGYSIDENNAQWTTAHLKQFLLELASVSGANSINVVAHSMGNRALTAAMQQIDFSRDEDAEPLFDRVVLAAPDVDADHFRRDLAPPLTNVAQQVTLYASSDDQALIASKQVHGHPRAGESGTNIVVVPGIETIDVSGIDMSLLGHSYYGDNESMLRDLYAVVRSRLPARQRNSLITRRAGELVYWQLAGRTVDSSARPMR